MNSYIVFFEQFLFVLSAQTVLCKIVARVRKQKPACYPSLEAGQALVGYPVTHSIDKPISSKENT